MPEPTTSLPIVRYGPTGIAPATDQLVSEEPMEIRLNGVALAVLMRTPGHDEDLLRGFAITEGIVLGPGEIANVTDLGEGRYELRLADGITVDPERFRRNLYATSSCGVCGKASIDAVRVTARPLPAGPMLSPEVVLSLPPMLLNEQASFATTGGLHAAAAFTASGELVAIREDVGRHNATDKLVGSLSQSAWPFEPLALMVSGRVSFEIIQKAAVAGLSFVAGVSAASSLAVELGEELGMTVAGFVREKSFNVYCGDQRISGAPSS